MSDKIIEGEIVHDTLAVPVAQPLAKKPSTGLNQSVFATQLSANATAEQQIDWFVNVADRWDGMSEELKDVVILLQRRFIRMDGGANYLTPAQAFMVVRFCKEKGLEVHSDHWFFDFANYKVNLSTSGLRAHAQYKQVNLGPPRLERIEREWPEFKKRLPGWTGKDWGYKCSMKVGDKDKGDATYEAWFSTSAQRNKEGTELRKGPWSDNPDHMVQIAAQRNGIKNALGAGVSQEDM